MWICIYLLVEWFLLESLESQLFRCCWSREKVPLEYILPFKCQAKLLVSLPRELAKCRQIASARLGTYVRSNKLTSSVWRLTEASWFLFILARISSTAVIKSKAGMLRTFISSVPAMINPFCSRSKFGCSMTTASFGSCRRKRELGGLCGWWVRWETGLGVKDYVWRYHQRRGDDYQLEFRCQEGKKEKN